MVYSPHPDQCPRQPEAASWETDSQPLSGRSWPCPSLAPASGLLPPSPGCIPLTPAREKTWQDLGYGHGWCRMWSKKAHEGRKRNAPPFGVRFPVPSLCDFGYVTPLVSSLEGQGIWPAYLRALLGVQSPKTVGLRGKLRLNRKGHLRLRSTAPHFVDREIEAPRDETGHLGESMTSLLSIPSQGPKQAGFETACFPLSQELRCGHRA